MPTAARNWSHSHLVGRSAARLPAEQSPTSGCCNHSQKHDWRSAERTAVLCTAHRSTPNGPCCRERQEVVMASWKSLTSVPSFTPDTMLLMTDATVLVHDSGGQDWYRLKPNGSGRYDTGSVVWSGPFAMATSREYLRVRRPGRRTGLSRRRRVFRRFVDANRHSSGRDLRPSNQQVVDR